MTVDVLWSPKAEEDLIDIHSFIALENETAADDVIEKIKVTTDLLAHHPRLGQRRPEIDPSFRMVTEGPYLILYETFPDTDIGPVATVIIIRVIDGRRDLSALF